MNQGISSEGQQAEQWYPLSRGDINTFIRSLSSAYEVVGVQKKRGRLTLDTIEDPDDLLLEFSPQVHSPKKFLFPNWEKLFRFHVGGKVLLESEKAAAPRVIFGMHPCDIHAVRVLDDCLFEGEADSAYQAKREATVLIGVDCIPDSHCFCTSMGTDRVARGFDLFLHRHGEDFLLQVGNRRGGNLIRHFAPKLLQAEKSAPLPLQNKLCYNTLHFPYEALAPLLQEEYDHPIWAELGEKCLGCGACTLVCPSCYCFNVEDRLDLCMESGDRIRLWDSCQLDQFTSIAGGENFRSNQADRQRHRFFRKYKYLWDKHKRTACVGCGRCLRECLSGIDPLDVLNRLFVEKAIPAMATSPGSEYHPQLADIVEVHQLSDREKLFHLRLPDPITYTPGSFMEVSVFGLGEAPFTIASGDQGAREIDLAVRTDGALTKALHRLQPGDTVGIRGPFGSGFPLNSFLGRDVLLVAADLGLVTLRSLLQTILERREHFGRVVLLYEAQDVSSLLFRDELLKWHRGNQIDCRFAINDPENEWGIPLNDISHLFRDLDLNPSRTTAAVSGPAGMYRFTNPLLLRMGFDEEHIFINLERHMKCGLGKCGKCRINDICVCESGPIFPYSKVRHLKEAIER